MLLLQQGRTDEAASLLREAVGEFERLGAPFEAARARESLALVAPAAEASTALDAARETYEQLGARPHAARVHALLTKT